MKHIHTVRLTSDDVTSECDFHLTPVQLNLVLEMAQRFNAQARWSSDIRWEIDPTDSAANPGDAA